MTTETRVGLGLAIPFVCWFCYMAGLNNARCPEAINSIPAAKFKSSADYRDGVLRCYYSVNVLPRVKGKRA